MNHTLLPTIMHQLNPSFYCFQARQKKLDAFMSYFNGKQSVTTSRIREKLSSDSFNEIKKRIDFVVKHLHK